MLKKKPESSLFPPPFKDRSSTDQSEESPADGFTPLEQEIKRHYRGPFDSKTLQLTEKDLELLGQYLRKLLVVDPSLRGTPNELLTEPWVSYVTPGVEGSD